MLLRSTVSSRVAASVLLVAVLSDATLAAAPAPAPSSMGFDAWFVVVVLVLMTAALLLNVFNLVSVMIIVPIVFHLAGIITEAELFSGLVNNGVLVIALMSVLSQPVAELPVIKRIFRSFFNGASGNAFAVGLLKVLVISMVVSSVTTDVAQVSVMTSILLTICTEKDIPVRQVLMPVTFAINLANLSILGNGANVVLSGLLEDAGFPPLGFFELSKVVAPQLVVYTAYLMLSSRFLAPAEKPRKSADRTAIVARAATATEPVSTAGAGSGDAHAPGVELQLSRDPSVVSIDPEVQKNLRFLVHPDHFVVQMQVLKQSQLLGTPYAGIPERFPRLKLGILAVCHKQGDMAVAAVVKPAHEAFQMLRVAVGDVVQLSAAPSLLLDLSRTLGMKMLTANNGVASERLALLQAPSVDFAAEASSAHPTSPRAPGSPTLGNFQVPGTSFLGSFAGAVADITSEDATIYTLVVAPENPFVGWTVASRAFQRKFGVCILSIRSASLRQPDVPIADLPQHTLAAADALLVLAPRDFLRNNRHSLSNFLFIDSAEEGGGNVVDAYVLRLPVWLHRPCGGLFTVGQMLRDGQGAYCSLIMPHWWSSLSAVIFLGVIVAGTVGTEGLATYCLYAIALYVALGLTTPEAVLQQINYQMYVVAAFSFPLGKGISKSGLAGYLGQGVASWHISGFVLHLLIGTVTVLFCLTITNRAATQVAFKFVLAIYAALGKNPLPGVVCVAVCVNLGIGTVYGLSTNLLIVGPGKYTASDFAKVGLPITVATVVMTAVMASAVYGEW